MIHQFASAQRRLDNAVNPLTGGMPRAAAWRTMLNETASRPPARPYGRWLLALFFVAAGANHFINPAPYLSMMPSYLPAHKALVDLSGVAEILGGLGALHPRTRVFSGWGLILLLIAVFPANLQVALHGWPGTNLPAWLLWARLPLQFLLITWVYRSCIAAARPRPAFR